MRFEVILATAFAALASAQTTTTNGAATTTRSRTPVETCLDKCDAGDSYCSAACVGVPHPNTKAANDNTNCANKCDQGDGSPEDTKAFGECLQACANKYIITASLTTITRGGEGPTVVTVIPGVTTTGGSSSDDSDSSSETVTTTTKTNTADSQSTTSSDNAAMNVQIGSMGGFAGLLLAGLALL